MLKRKQLPKKLTALKGPPLKKVKLPEPESESEEDEELEVDESDLGEESFDEDDVDMASENEDSEAEDGDEESDEDEVEDKKIVNNKNFLNNGESSDDELDDLDPRSFVLAPVGGDEENDSDQEVEIALNAGLVNANGLGFKSKEREYVNYVDKIKQKLFQMTTKDSWAETVDVVAAPELVYTDDINNDFEREALFYKQAQDGARKAIAKLKNLKIPVERPEDYFAEMVKPDTHMHRVRNVLQSKKKEVDRRETVRRLRTEKKFATKVQKETEKNQRTEKRKFLEAVKKHRKGMKGQLDTMLSNARSMEMDEDTGPAGRSDPRKGGRNGGGRKMVSRTARDKKYGFGGKKRGLKRNDKASFEDIGKKRGKFSGKRR